MTALAMDVREFSFDEIDMVSGSWRREVYKWFVRMVRDGVAFELAKAAAQEMEDHLDDLPDLRTDRDPYTLSKIG